MSFQQRTVISGKVLCLLACMLVVECAFAQTIVVPNALQAVEGSSNICFPFDLYDYSFNSQRYQQVYAASEFSGAGGPILIREIAFRPDAGWGRAFSGVLPRVQINLSTTAVGPGNLSKVFAANIGANETIVFSGPLSLSSAFSGPSGGPKEFDIRISLETPFLYDPAAGNLLLDVRNFDGGALAPFDAFWGQSDAIANVYTYTPDGVNDAAGESPAVWKYGLVTQFVATAVIPAVQKVVPFDIKPQGCPNPWNVNSEGVLPAAILGTRDLDVATLDPASIRLLGVAPLRFALEDVATPYEPFQGKTGARDCSAGGPDGFPDLTLKFDSHTLMAAVRNAIGHDPVDGEVVVLTITGNLKEAAGGTEIQGEDVVVILKKGKK